MPFISTWTTVASRYCRTFSDLRSVGFAALSAGFCVGIEGILLPGVPVDDEQFGLKQHIEMVTQPARAALYLGDLC